MLIQKSIRKNVIHKRFMLGAHPIIQFFINKLNIADCIGSYISQDKRLKLSNEKALIVLIHNILTSPTPLYEIYDWAKIIDELILGLETNDISFLNDDRIGKALNSFYECKHKEIFFRLVLRAIKLFEIDCRQIHQDTTTVTFCGKYDGWNLSPFIKHGINKDHRPDLKQLVLGMTVTADGSVPLLHHIYDGNQTDDRVHVDNHKQLRRLLQSSDFIYVADCKLSTSNNLRKIDVCGGSFISVMPKTWSESISFLRKIKKTNIKWSFLLSKPDNRKPKSKKDIYYIAGGKYTTKSGYRLIWIKSAQKAELDSQIRKQNIDNAIKELKSMQAKLNKYSLKTHKAIKNKIEIILKKYNCFGIIAYTILENNEKITIYKNAGRPKTGDTGKLKINKYYTLAFQLNEDELKKESKTDGVFPLITNVKNYKAKRILEIYKFQPFLEKRHSQIKTYQKIAPVYLKKPARVIAYLHMHVMALMVATLMERQLRISMKKHSIKYLNIYPEERKCKYPTTFDVVRLFKNVERYEVIDHDKIHVFPAVLNKIQKQVLQLLDIPISVYQ